MKSLLTTALCLVVAFYAAAQTPQILKGNDFKMRQNSFKKVSGVDFAMKSLLAQGFKESNDEDDSFQITIESTEKGGKTTTMEVDMQAVENTAKGEMAIVAHIKQGNNTRVEITTGKLNQEFKTFKVNQVISAPNNKFQFNEIKMKGGPSDEMYLEEIDSEISSSYTLEPLVGASSAINQFFSCLSSEVRRDCSNACKDEILSCISKKKGSLARKIRAIFADTSSWYEVPERVVRASAAFVRFAGGLAECVASGTCGRCATTQVTQCVGSVF